MTRKPMSEDDRAMRRFYARRGRVDCWFYANIPNRPRDEHWMAMDNLLRFVDNEIVNAVMRGVECGALSKEAATKLLTGLKAGKYRKKSLTALSQTSPSEAVPG